MKKILVVLLILAVAGGVFAQGGTWSLGGGVEIGTRINLDPYPESDVDPATGEDEKVLVDGIAYHRWDAIRGTLNVGYARNNAFVGLHMNTNSETMFTTTFDGDAFRGKFQWSDLLSIIEGTGSGKKGDQQAIGGGFVKRLWGEYKFVDGMVTLVAAFKGDEAEYWISDKTGTFLDNAAKGTYIGGWFSQNPIDTDGKTFTFVDEWYGKRTSWGDNYNLHSNNYLLTAFDVGALNFGIYIPNLFMYSGFWGTGYTPFPGGIEFVDDVIKQSVIGVKFDQSPIEFAAQFQLENYGVYFGGRFTSGPIGVGLSFMGILDGDGQRDGADADPTQIKVGGRVEYNGDGFGGGLKGFYERQDLGMINNQSKSDNNDFYLSTIGIEPFFFYDAIPSHLRFALDVGFYFLNDTNNDQSEKITIWALQPQIFWNFLGTGAGSYWAYDTGIMIRYRMANADARDLPNFGSTTAGSVNFFDVVFKWGF